MSWLRMHAMLLFTTDPRGLTLHQVAEMEEFQELPPGTIATWAEEDDWIAQRQRVYDQWRETVEDRLGTEMAEARAAEFKELETLRLNYMTKLKNDTYPVKSAEGLIVALLKVGERLDLLRQSIAKDLKPASTDALPDIGLTPEDLDVAIDAINKHRREQLESKSAASQLDDGSDPGADPGAILEHQEG